MNISNRKALTFFIVSDLLECHVVGFQIIFNTCWTLLECLKLVMVFFTFILRLFQLKWFASFWCKLCTSDAIASTVSVYIEEFVSIRSGSKSAGYLKLIVISDGSSRRRKWQHYKRAKLFYHFQLKTFHYKIALAKEHTHSVGFQLPNKYQSWNIFFFLILALQSWSLEVEFI